MTDSGRMVPASTDAATLTLAAAVLMASEYPQAYTPDQAEALATRTVDAVMAIWDEVAARITAGSLVTPSG